MGRLAQVPAPQRAQFNKRSHTAEAVGFQARLRYCPWRRVTRFLKHRGRVLIGYNDAQNQNVICPQLIVD